MVDNFPADLRPAVEALSRLDNWIVARDAVMTLGASGDPSVVPVLCEFLATRPRMVMDGFWTVREEAARVLARLGDKRAVEPLCTMLDDWAPVAVLAAVDALGTLRDARAVEPLCRALQSNYYEVRAPAARALGKIGDARAIQPLLACLQTDPALRIAAVNALATIGDKSAAQGISSLLHNEDENTRWSAAEALGKLGSPEALPALQDRLRFFGGERRRNVRSAIRAAIKEIERARRSSV